MSYNVRVNLIFFTYVDSDVLSFLNTYSYVAFVLVFLMLSYFNYAVLLYVTSSVVRYTLI
jgi:hypothetical protein